METELASAISHQVNHKAESLDKIITDEAKKQAKDDNCVWAQG